MKGGVRDLGGCSGKNWNAAAEYHLGRGRRLGRVLGWEGSAVNIPPAQKALLCALSLFRQEMSADLGLVGCHGRLAHRVGGVG